MSLHVSIIAKNKGFDTSELEREISPDRNDIFGFESTRQSLWGHDAIKNLGCELINSLKETDVFAFDEDVEVLKNEFLTILKNIDLISEQINLEKWAIEIRVLNALEVIRIVERNLDEVGVALG